MASIHVVYDKNDKVIFNQPDKTPKVKGVHWASLRLDETFDFSPEEIETTAKCLAAMLLNAMSAE